MPARTVTKAARTASATKAGKVAKKDVPKKKPAAKAPKVAASKDIFTVDEIKAEKTEGVRVGLIKWEGYPESMNTWEPAKNILDPSLIRDFKDRVTTLTLSLATAPRKEGSDDDQASSSTPHVDPTQNVGGFWTQLSAWLAPRRVFGAGLWALKGLLFLFLHLLLLFLAVIVASGAYQDGGGYNTGDDTDYDDRQPPHRRPPPMPNAPPPKRSNDTGGGYCGDNRGTTTYSFAPQHGSPRNSGGGGSSSSSSTSTRRGFGTTTTR